MEAHNSKTRLGTSEVPLVVKFADAKRKDPTPHHVSSPLHIERAQGSILAFSHLVSFAQAPHCACEGLHPRKGPLVEGLWAARLSPASLLGPLFLQMQMHGGWMGGPLGPRHLDAYSNALGNGLGLGGMGGYQHLGGDMLNDHSLLNNMGLIGNG